MMKGKNNIGFSQSGKGTTKYRTFNPQENVENETEFTEATREEIDKACDLAAEAFKSYRNFDGKKRAEFLNAITVEILELGEDLLEMYCDETGLAKGRAEGERARMIGQLHMFAKLIEDDNWRNPVKNPEDSDLRKLSIPIGPIAVFGASNFAFAFSTAGGDTASALAAGCPVIVKSHPMHSGTGEMIANAIVRAAKKTGMPEGVFSNLNSSGNEVGERLVTNKNIKAVGFTGSLRGGSALFDLAAKREEPIPVFAEMGSINPIVITPKAIENRSVEIAVEIAGSIMLGAGQFCTNPGLILSVMSEKLDAFVSDLGKNLIEMDAQCMLHPKIQKKFRESREDAIVKNGAELVSENNNLKDNYTNATLAMVFGNAFLKNKKLHEEVFGPYSMVVKCEDEEQLIEVINALEGQLTGTIMAEKDEIETIGKIAEALQQKVGRLIFNGVPTGVTVCDAMMHGGPYPASSDSRFTAVGNGAIQRWVRPFSYQGFPKELLPDILK